MTATGRANALALAVPAALMLGALGSQYIGGLHPCEMCYWQRWPHDAAIVAALFALGTRSAPAKRWLIAFAALAIFTSGAIGAFHAGVEYGWWEGLTQCTAAPGAGGGDILADIMKAPLIRCDQPQWTLWGVSLAGFNAIISIGAALAIWKLLRHKAV